MNIITSIIMLFIFIIHRVRCDSGIKLSVIMPVYNTEKFLDRSIQSVLNQTLVDIELICIDDSSKDKSLDILRKYEDKDKRVKVIHLEKNSGPSAARNIGIEKASGEFIGFMDSDDLADKKFFKYLYDFSEGKDVVVGKFVFSTNLTNKYYHHPWGEKRGNIIDTIFRRSYINKYNIRFPVEKRMAEDWTFRDLAYSHTDKIFKAPDNGIYYIYKRRENSLCGFGKKSIEKFTRYAKYEFKKNEL